MLVSLQNHLSFEGVCCKLMSSWPPARVKWGWELRPLRHFGGIRGIRGWTPRGHFLCAGIANAPNIDGNGRPFSTPSHPKVHLGAHGVPRGTKYPILIPERRHCSDFRRLSFMLTKEKLIKYKEKWQRGGITKNPELTGKYRSKISFYQKHDLFLWSFRSYPL